MCKKICTLTLVFCFFILWGCGSPESPVADDRSDEKKEISKPGILFFGNSLTAGLGLADPDTEAWPALIGARLRQEGYDYEIWNAGLSGDTTSGGLGRLEYVLRREPIIFVLELGANDSMRGVPLSVIRRNLETIIDRVREAFPRTRILLIGMKTFPNLGKTYRQGFDQIYPQIAVEKKVLLVPFLLEGVAGNRALNQEDGIHPTKEGHRIMADTVYPYLKKLL